MSIEVDPLTAFVDVDVSGDVVEVEVVGQGEKGDPGGGAFDGDASDVPYTPATEGDWDPVPDQVAEALDELAGREVGGGAVDSVNGETGAVVLDAADVGALASGSGYNTANGWLKLDGDGTVPDNRIPSSIARDSEVVALGETSSTAYRGDRGKTAYDHSQVVTGNPHGTTAADVGAAAASHTHAASDITSGTVATARLGSGTADSTTFLRGDQTWATPAGGSSVAPFYGTGVDGGVTISGSTTLTADMYYNNLEVTGTLICSNFRVFVAGTLSGNGAIHTDGTDATSASAPATWAAGTLGGGCVGGNGGTAAGTQAAAVTFRIGGNGGAGGTGTSGAGGAAQTGTDPTAAGGGSKIKNDLLAVMRGYSLNYAGVLRAGMGGSGGGGDGTAGGGGGSGGGQAQVFAYRTTFTGVISAKGGAGFTPAAGNRGGGGGGGGGIVVVVTGSATQTFTTNVAGGTGGSGTGTGTAGSNGSAGTALVKIGFT